MLDKSQQKAVAIADKVCLDVLQRLRPGLVEEELAGWIRTEMKLLGADRHAFRIIVASGKRSAKPHGYAHTKKINKNEIVMLDLGAVVLGHHSDLTRTIFLGRPEKRFKKIYRIVLEAQKKAIAVVRHGRSCREVDKAAREYIEKKGFGRYFIHSTGHGIGKKIHQGPSLSQKSRAKLRAGMIITIEPGIYIKGWGGIRIEDMVLVTKKGCRILTRCPKIMSIKR